MELVPPPGVLIILMSLDGVAIDYVIVPHQGRFRSLLSRDLSDKIKCLCRTVPNDAYLMSYDYECNYNYLLMS